MFVFVIMLAYHTWLFAVVVVVVVLVEMLPLEELIWGNFETLIRQWTKKSTKTPYSPKKDGCSIRNASLPCRELAVPPNLCKKEGYFTKGWESFFKGSEWNFDETSISPKTAHIFSKLESIQFTSKHFFVYVTFPCFCHPGLWPGMTSMYFPVI